VADYRPAEPADCKIKKVNDTLEVRMERTVDILAAVAARAQRPFMVGFAAETNDVEKHALSKLERKRLDLIAANEVGTTLGFDCADNELQLFWPGGSERLARADKQALARLLIDRVAERYAARERAAAGKGKR
jgi:phosphopantothenoylcysteine decarboxylase/phosphopantothenate--cysteine ligase